MLTLRAATLADAALLLAWRNDPVTLAASFTSGEVTADEHEAWLTRRLADPSCQLWIAEQAGAPVGQARIDADGEISISIDSAARGRGLAAQVIELACRAATAPIIVARVKSDNQASLRAFVAAGFEQVRASAESVELQRAQ